MTSGERILLIYKNQNRLFVSWDAASWHVSKKLYKVVGEINGDAFRTRHKTPLVDLMPLPSGAQFLNVIESVFSGMARANHKSENHGWLVFFTVRSLHHTAATGTPTTLSPDAH
jgi:hypothetical protein